LTMAVAKTTQAGRVVGLDSANGFIEYARAHYSEPRVTFELGDAQALPFPDASFDRCMSLLVMRYIPDALKAAREMRRVTGSGGVLGTAMWDSGGGHQINQCLWDAAAALDPQLKFADESGSYGSAEELKALWTGTGLTSIEAKALSFPCEFSCFEELWMRRFIEGQGLTAAYVKGLSQERREALRQRLRQEVLRSRPDGPFTLTAKAWAVRGIVPEI
jgi:SAM-dependent methyltransferase